jgi:hypothetical protein
MGKVREVKPAKLIVGLLFCRLDLLTLILERIKDKWGSIDFISPTFPFEHTDYYHREMGEKLWRCFVSFERLIPMESLPQIKIQSNYLEEEFSPQGNRQINIDPGYLDASKMILATTKDFFHRAYLGQGIYAHLNLYFQKVTFHPLPWTYPDYMTAEALQFFSQVRTRYLQQIKEK